MSWVAAAIAGSTIVGAVVANNNKPKAPEAPDLTKAQVEGIKADAATLPFRLQVNQAAETGGVYTDPETGMVYDFRGRFDPVRFFDRNPQAKEQYQQENADKGEVRDPQSFAHDWLVNNGKGEGALDDYHTGSQAYRTQSDIDTAKQVAQAGADISDESARRQLKTQLELLPEFNKLNLDQQKTALDNALEYQKKSGAVQRGENELTFDQNLALGKKGTFALADWQKELLPGINDLSLAEQKKGFNASMDASKEAFRGNLDMADTAADRASALQNRVLPGLNDLSLRLQSDAVRSANDVGREVNSTAYGVRDSLGAQLMKELAAGDDLTDAQRERNQQSVRRAQAARGNILGDAASFDEALSESDLAEQIANNRKGNALSFINSRDLAPTFSAVGVANPTQVVSPNLAPANFNVQTAVNPLMPNFGGASTPNFSATTAAMPNLAPASIAQSDPLSLMNPNAGSAAANNAASVWQTQTNVAANTPNPWMQGLGLGLQAYGSIYSPKPKTTSPCWVARAVLGETTGQWKLFRAWLLLEAPAWFRDWYVRQGEQFATWLSDKPAVRVILRPAFEARANQMEAFA